MNAADYLQKQAAEHRLKPGDEVTRLSATRQDGTPWTRLYRYDTAAAIVWADSQALVNARRERVAWDGVEGVSFYNGD